LVFDSDAARSLSPSQADAHTALMEEELERVWAAAPALSAASAQPSGEQATTPKGKEKAGYGPLKLLDLPMDILKEIIHQVSRSRGRSRLPSLRCGC
jgi:hypothetical protein